MPAYKSYPSSELTPSRRTRKGERNSVFQANRKMARVARKARREALRAEN